MAKPSAQMQCSATGTVSTNAVVPLHRCSGPAHGGAAEVTPGSRPHIHIAVVSWTINRTEAPVVSHAFICNMPEKPSVTSGRPAGSCTPA